MRDYITKFIRSHRCLSVFTLLQLTLMLSMLEFTIQIDQSPELQRPLARIYLVCKLGELAWSPLFSGFAMGAMFYGYGLIYLPTKCPFGGFFSRLRIAGLSLWQHCSPVMLLPWGLKVAQGLGRFPYHIWECLAEETHYEADNFLLFSVLAVMLWNYLMILAISSFVLAIGLNRRLLSARHLESRNHELRAYAQGINELLGFEMFVMT
ncbi:uncharacterized protein LOC108111406 [Drosophila eugracilis]|uniref:uncharacterized protein LOC108111406 n=1 Tax=Drosophila eugracilis TaxID=29029 RepID=UPI001BDB0B22|nr:uncharacterized protein LOC108111406 [Drosophila eugracilis]